MSAILEKPKKKVQLKLQTKYRESSQVIVHCYFKADCETLIRIWASTYLVDVHSGAKYSLVLAEGITMFPYWTKVPNGSTFKFTLIFKGLSKDCTAFDLHEQIPQSDGFYVPNIQRNESDVYHIEI